MAIKIVRDTIAKQEIKEVALERFGDLVKAVVDIDRGIMAVGGEMHADEEASLLEDGARQEDLWGVNLYPGLPDDQWIEFDSMINIRPGQNNNSRDIESSQIRDKIVKIIRGLVKNR